MVMPISKASLCDQQLWDQLALLTLLGHKYYAQWRQAADGIGTQVASDLAAADDAFLYFENPSASGKVMLLDNRSIYASEGPGVFAIYSNVGDVTLESTGEDITPANRRSSGPASAMKFRVLTLATDPTFTTIVPPVVDMADSGITPSKPGGDLISEADFRVVEPGAKFGIKYTNNGDTAAVLNMGFLYYEVPVSFLPTVDTE